MADRTGRRLRGRRGSRLQGGGIRRSGGRGAVRRSQRARGRRNPVQRARSHLKAYRKATLLTVALTGFLLLFFGQARGGRGQEVSEDSIRQELPDTVSIIQQVPLDELQRPDTAAPEPDSLTRVSAREARQTLRDLWYSFVGTLPKLGVAIGIFLLAWLLVRLVRPLLHAILGKWPRADAFVALTGIGIWLVAFGVAFSVLAGDIAALLGSLGLIGLALSWALQTPIESFTGWVLNSMRGYYRVGDRIAVGDVFGDVYRIDFLTTTVWEYGGADRPPGWVRAEQPTGRIITFPNNEVLTGTVVNYTRDFPFVWDELSISVAPESDLRYAMQVVRGTACEVLGDYMAEPAHLYQSILTGARLEVSIDDEPEVYLSLTEWSADVVVRYLVDARAKRTWKSRLSLRVMEEINRPEHAGRILPAYPRRQLQWIDAGGAPRDGRAGGLDGEEPGVPGP